MRPATILPIRSLIERRPVRDPAATTQESYVREGLALGVLANGASRIRLA
jgi:hypothetical protein